MSNEKETVKLSELDIGQLTKVVLDHDLDMARAHDGLRRCGVELLTRANKTDISGDLVIQWIEDGHRTPEEIEKVELAVGDYYRGMVDKPVEPEPTPDRSPVFDRFDPKLFEYAAMRGDIVVIDGGMSQQLVAELIYKAMVKDGGNEIVVRVIGKCPAIYIGGGDRKAKTVHYDNGTPVSSIQFIGVTSDAEISGLKFDDDYGGIDGEIRLSGTLKVSPVSNSDGTGQGDKACIACRTLMPNLHLVMEEGIDTVVPEEWTRYDGFGAKWGVFLMGCKLTAIRPIGDPKREHEFYIKNMVSSHVYQGTNRTRMWTDPAGATRELGNGRTYAQHSNRVPDVYPKGGPPSQGDVIFEECNAVCCGWEGMLAWEKKGTKLVPVLDDDGEETFYTDGDPILEEVPTIEVRSGKKHGGGGFDFTGHGNTGASFQVLRCKSTRPHCGSVANWNEPGPKEKRTENNSSGLRCWMIDAPSNGNPTGAIINPLTTSLTVAGHATRLVIIEGYEVIDKPEGTRVAFQVSGTKRLEMTGCNVNGDPVGIGTPHLKLDHQDGQTPIEMWSVDLRLKA